MTKVTRHRLPTALFLLCGILATGGCSSEPSAPAPAPPPPQEKKVEVGVTPWGTVTKIETADSWSEKGMEKRLRAKPGHQLWILHIGPKPTTSEEPVPSATPDFNAMARHDVKKSSLLDASGDEHGSPLWAAMTAATKPTDKPGWVTLDMQIERIVYTMPRDRQPKALRLGDGTEVPLTDR
ncbi:MAG TPA: hypothetical protein VNN18_08135 [Candidatus Xenobia bacterium]|nr:hypothetical protein [Candidatus Xenobia bacterium]